MAAAPMAPIQPLIMWQGCTELGACFPDILTTAQFPHRPLSCHVSYKLLPMPWDTATDQVADTILHVFLTQHQTSLDVLLLPLGDNICPVHPPPTHTHTTPCHLYSWANHFYQRGMDVNTVTTPTGIVLLHSPETNMIQSRRHHSIEYARDYKKPCTQSHST